MVLDKYQIILYNGTTYMKYQKLAFFILKSFSWTFWVRIASIVNSGDIARMESEPSEPTLISIGYSFLVIIDVK